MNSNSIPKLVRDAAPDFGSYEEVYKHFHANPELSNLEEQTAKKVASQLEGFQCLEIHTGIGGHGLAGVMRNGSGKTVLLRADMDALPVEEQTGLPYASSVKMIDTAGIERSCMHACGHDMHVTCLLAATEVLMRLKESWTGTLIVLFQPAEERGTGANAMIQDGLYDKIPIPDIVLGQHVMALPSGTVGCKIGTIMAAADSFKITLYGRGGHGSMPHRTIDPVMMAANLIVRLQNIVSRETDPSDMAVLSVGSIQAGHTENIIGDSAELGIDIRSIRPQTRKNMLNSIKRILHAEFIASGGTKEPKIVPTRSFPLTINEESDANLLAESFEAAFGQNFDVDTPRTNASEDVSVLATSQGKPSLFWFFGGVDPRLWEEKEKAERLAEDIPVNHSPFFAPVIQPTMRIGVEALSIAALTFFS